MKEKIKLTDAEYELISAIRNYRASFPNGYPQLLWFCQECFDKLVDLPANDSEEDEEED